MLRYLTLHLLGQLLLDVGQHLARGDRDLGARAKDRAHANVVEELVVLRRDDAAAHDQHVLGTLLLELLDQRRDQGLVAGGLGRDADHMHIGVDGLASDLLGRLEQRTNVDVWRWEE